MLKAAQGRIGAKVGKKGEAKGKHVLGVQSVQGVGEEWGEAAVGMSSQMRYKEGWSALRTRL